MTFLSEFLAHSGHPVCTPPDPQAKAIIGCHSPFFPYPHFGQIRAILRLLPQVTSCGDTELAVGCHIAATRGHSSATVPRCLRYRHSKSLTVQPHLPVYGCFRTLQYLQLCCRRYHIYPQGHADFCRYSSVQIPQIPGFGLLHYP